MKVFLQGFAILTLCLSSMASASILPPNDLDQQDFLAPSNITEQEFNQIIDVIIEQYKPLAALHGAELVVDKKWNDPTVNAYAMQQGNTWRVAMFGGLARRPEVTKDGFALVVCHELGHHFGGYVFKDGHWASAEGQADYYATHTCARKIWYKSLEKNESIARNINPRLISICERTWKNPDDVALCGRVAEAGLSLAKLLGALGREPVPDLNTRDNSQVDRTVTYHPKAQCRLDTYLSGALCTQMPNLKVIPGKKGNGGQYNTPETEQESAKYTCMASANFKEGPRPRCWFKELGGSKFRKGDHWGEDLAGLEVQSW